MAKILKHIDFSNKPIKLEVGSGGMPHEGYIHLDVREDAPHVEIQCMMGEEAIPLPDGCCEEILSNHSIEHVSWPKVGNVVSDWARVLKSGGKLFLRTPDLEFICKMYVEGKYTKEHPVDESNMVGIFGDYNASHWANIKLFAGQNFNGNTHYFCLDFPMLKDLLERHGFTKVERLTDQPVFSPGEICAVAYKI